MNRKFERRLVLIAGIWQVAMGFLTIFVYAPRHRREGLDLIYEAAPLPLVEAEAINSLFSSLYMFIVTFGMLFVVLGLINIFLSTKIKDNKVEKKIPLFLLICGVGVYFLMDFISTIMLVSASILMLAKNKSIGRLNHGDTEVL